MEDRSVEFLVLILAVATPLLAGYMALNARGRGAAPFRPGRLLVLALAGPLNALAWLLLQGPLQGAPNRTAFGIGLAALVFIALGFGAGWMRRAKDHEGGKPGAPPASPKV